MNLADQVVVRRQTDIYDGGADLTYEDYFLFQLHLHLFVCSSYPHVDLHAVAKMAILAAEAEETFGAMLGRMLLESLERT